MIAVFDHIAVTSLAALQMDHLVTITGIHPIYDGRAVMSVYGRDIVDGIEVGGGRTLGYPSKRYAAITELYALGDDSGAGNAGWVFISE